MKYIDVKYTQWTRFYLKEDANIEDVIEQLKESDDIDEIVDSHVYSHSEDLFDTSEYMSPKENQAATIEVYNEENECIWQNFESM